jgi:hypothetical protein
VRLNPTWILILPITIFIAQLCGKSIVASNTFVVAVAHANAQARAAFENGVDFLRFHWLGFLLCLSIWLSSGIRGGMACSILKFETRWTAPSAKYR